MNNYEFYDMETGEVFTIVADNIGAAIVEAAHMVIDGTAFHPVFWREV